MVLKSNLIDNLMLKNMDFVCVGISHGVPSVNDSCERLIIKQTFDGVDWMEVEPYKSHLFYSYPDNKTTFPPV